MAIYRLEVKAIRRSEGRDARAAAAYRSGTRIGPHDYTRRQGVVQIALFLPPLAPAWSRAELWSQAEAAERRKNSVTAREVLLALPHELPLNARIRLVETFSRFLVGRYGVAVDMALHAPRNGEDARNHHAHLLMTTRRLSAKGLGEKTRELDDKTTGPLEVEALRGAWCAMLKRAGFNLEHRAAPRQPDPLPVIAPRPVLSRRPARKDALCSP